jgi:hypothetical protein
MVRFVLLILASAAAASAQIAILQVQIVDGEGVIHVPGARASRPMVIAVTDESNHPVVGAAVSIHLPENGPGGTFPNGLRTVVEITDARGRCAVRGFQANRQSGRFQIQIVAAKEQARAATVSFQYVGETKGGSTAKGRAPWRRGKWVAIAAVAGGGAAAALVATRGSNSSPGAPAAPTPPALTIGAPTISVAKP